MPKSQCAASVQNCPQEATMNKKITILYERISRDDGDGESNSITTQRTMLESYAGEHGYTPFVNISDDGFSGKDFERPGWQELMNYVDAGKVSTILLKSMDRMGRNYLQVGMYRELFRERGIRLIAINDNYDSVSGEGDEFMPFKDIMSEWYVRDTSRKIKSAFRTRGMAGKHTSSCPPYGYLKSSGDKNQWIVDTDVSDIVKRIFAMTIEGYGPYQIACILQNEKVLIPGAYLATKGAGLHQHKVFDNPYKWGSSTICSILKKKEYLGHTVNFKSTKNSYKDKKNHYVPESEWVIFPDTHEPIIDQQTYDTVQRLRENVKRRPDGWGYTHPLTGILRCADCGAKLYVQRINNGKAKPYYTCYNYRRVPVSVNCPTPHRVDADTVMELLRSTLSKIVKFAISDREAFAKLVREKLSAQFSDDVKKQKKRLSQIKKRAADLEALLRKIYEDNALGKLPDKRYGEMSAAYEKEQSDAEREAAELQSAVDEYIDGSERADRFINLIERYENFDELSVTALNELVEKIVVHERDRKSSAQTTQQIDIYLTFIGNFELPKSEVDTAETAAQEAARLKKEATKDRLHQNYLRRKENGKQAEYERKYEPLRKARFQERKAAAKEIVASLAESEGKSPIWQMAAVT
ncbi:recombinase [Clostridia bacterium]|nr:recombinase [Clostridia bacterium]